LHRAEELAEDVKATPGQAGGLGGGGDGDAAARWPERLEVKSFPLGMVLAACPEILDYGPGGTIASWRELMAAAVVVRSMLGVSPSAYQAACDTMGPENAATVMACILERANHINSAGGYLRTLTDRAKKGEFGLGPMLMALIKANQGQVRKAG
jgi:replication initiation protein RepC